VLIAIQFRIFQRVISYIKLGTKETEPTAITVITVIIRIHAAVETPETIFEEPSNFCFMKPK
jgi:hypothetical protein